MIKNKIVIKGARVHNLKNIALEIPKNKLVVITGLSGSGKSSLAFDTIYAEGQRRYAESFSAYARQFLGTVDKPDVDQIEGLSPTISLDQRTLANNPRSTVGTMTEIYDYLRLFFSKAGDAFCLDCGGRVEKKKVLFRPHDKKRQAKNKYLDFFLCRECGAKFPRLEPRLFSFNSPQGACASCKGLGVKMDVDFERIVPNKRLSLAEGAIQPWSKFFSNQILYWKQLEELAKKHKISWDNPVETISSKQWEIILYGEKDGFEGVANILLQKYERTESDFLRREIGKYLRENTCPDCQGKRLSSSALSVKVRGASIADLAEKDLVDLSQWFSKWKAEKKEEKILLPLVKEIKKRLKSVLDIGLGYLTLDRSVVTLSGGEVQRIKIAGQLNALLSNIVYVLDEPSVGLHPQDIDKMIATLRRLRDLDNTVIVVEHDENIIRAADWIVDIGPGSGLNGGEVVAVGKLAKVLKSKQSLTALYLKKKEKIVLPSKTLDKKQLFLKIKGAREHNLKNIDVKIPLGKFICVTGVSGSGKSTLVIDILGKFLAKKFYRANKTPGRFKEIQGAEYLNKVVRVDQSPIGKTPRSNPATYTGIFTYIRNLFASLPESLANGYDPGFFSFNVDGGRCPLCSGEGYVKVEMQFLSDIYVECESCQGRRYSEQALGVFYKNKNIADILDMEVGKAVHFFKDYFSIHEKLNLLKKVGLGYLPLGQAATTLSGGEAQRIKLVTELSKKDTGKTLYILDEPTTGLHFDDIAKLLSVLKMLVERGNTVVVIEHNLDIIRSADWIIDMGPKGGNKGGYIVAEGPPGLVAKNKRSVTGNYLAKILK